MSLVYRTFNDSNFMKRLILLLTTLGLPMTIFACDTCKLSKPKPGQRVVEYDLTIAEQMVSPAGKAVR